MSYRVCIPCAGTGSRLGTLTQFINKSLISIANRPALSLLLEQFPRDVEFVIALGHKGNLVREFLTLAYPSRTFYFVEVIPFEGPGAGLGLSLQACKHLLQQPFVFISCDTLVGQRIPAPNANWMGYAEVTKLDSYRTIAVTTAGVRAIAEKGEGQSPESKAYIGLAGIHGYQRFWDAMERGGQAAIEIGEAYGMRSLLDESIQAYCFTWHDTGNLNALAKARKHYRESVEPNILEKTNEAIWFVGDTVIKFSDDKKFIANRVARAQQLRGFVPEISGFSQNMYCYLKVHGEVLSGVVKLPLFDRLLEHGEQFWAKESFSMAQTKEFKDTCMKFYRDKTFERVELFYKNFNRQDGVETINCRSMPTLASLLNAIDWDWLVNGLPGRFHGDFHFENILWSSADQRFVFLDWRQDFGGNLSAGDIYYDFAKLFHGLIISHEVIAGDFFCIDWNSESISYDFHRKQILVDCERYFSNWLETHGYDIKKVRVLTALIYLNIAALHHRPYSLLLYALGKSMLKSELGI
jgi:hypothetical protein